MPLNPLEYMPYGLMRQIESKEVELNRHPSSDKSALFPPHVLENIDFSMLPPEKQVHTDVSIFLFDLPFFFFQNVFGKLYA